MTEGWRLADTSSYGDRGDLCNEVAKSTTGDYGWGTTSLELLTWSGCDTKTGAKKTQWKYEEKGCGDNNYFSHKDIDMYGIKENIGTIGEQCLRLKRSSECP